MTSPEDVREFFADVRMASHAADMHDAIGFVVVSHDDENGNLHITGPYPSPEAALIAAQRDHESVNHNLPEGEVGWTHRVFPLFPAS